jgi:hypothetical protein
MNNLKVNESSSFLWYVFYLWLLCFEGIRTGSVFLKKFLLLIPLSISQNVPFTFIFDKQSPWTFA